MNDTQAEVTPELSFWAEDFYFGVMGNLSQHKPNRPVSEYYVGGAVNMFSGFDRDGATYRAFQETDPSGFRDTIHVLWDKHGNIWQITVVELIRS